MTDRERVKAFFRRDDAKRWRKAWELAQRLGNRVCCPCPGCCDDAVVTWADDLPWSPGNNWWTAHDVAASLALDGAPISELP